jgi:PKD repeat protein
VGEKTTYQVSVKNGAGCETIKSQTVYGVLQPQAAYSYKVVKDRTVEFKFEGTNTANVYWNFSDGNESFQQNTTYTFSADGTYKVMLVANNPPCGSDTIYFDVTVAQSNSAVIKLGLNGLVISPNPTSDLINVKFAGFEQKLKAEILSLDGQLILTKEFENLNGNVGFALNLGNITNGIYILQLRNDSIGIVKKIQIQH